LRKSNPGRKTVEGVALLSVVAERAGLSREEVYQKVGAVLEEKYGLYEVLKRP
jgi:translation initiation factor 2 alpha subunit (eIF-2alpha)